MTKEEFIKSYCERSGITERELMNTQSATPCDCGHKTCEGWAMVSKAPPKIATLDDHRKEWEKLY
jgi:hypothetical protein